VSGPCEPERPALSRRCRAVAAYGAARLGIHRVAPPPRPSSSVTVCARGFYEAAANATRCSRCDANSYCPGGDKVENPVSRGSRVQCGPNLVTRNTGARTQADCGESHWSHFERLTFNRLVCVWRGGGSVVVGPACREGSVVVGPACSAGLLLLMASYGQFCEPAIVCVTRYCKPPELTSTTTLLLLSCPAAVAPAGYAQVSPSAAAPCGRSEYAPQFNRLARCLR